MAKKGSGKGTKGGGNKPNPVAGAGSLTDQQWDALQRQFELQDRAFAMAQAEANRQQQDYERRTNEARALAEAREQQAREDEERAAQFKALQDVAKIYENQANVFGTRMGETEADFAKRLQDLGSRYGGLVEGLTQRAGETKAEFDRRKSEAESRYSGLISGFGSQFNEQAAANERQRQAILQQLAEAIQSGETTIGGAQEQLMRDLVRSQAYSDIPLVELGQVANPLLAGLQAEGAGTAGVQQQSAMDAAIAGQLAALSRGAARQLNVGEENYFRALQNAGALAAQQARSSLAATGAARRQGVQSQFDALANQIAAARLEAIQRAEAERESVLSGIAGARSEALSGLEGRQFDVAASRAEEEGRLAAAKADAASRLAAEQADARARAAEAMAQAQGYAPVVRATPMPTIPEPSFDYAAALDAARRKALEDLRAAMGNKSVVPPPAAAGGTKPPPAAAGGTKPPNKNKNGRKDPWSGTPTVYNELL